MCYNHICFDDFNNFKDNSGQCKLYSIIVIENDA